MAKGLESFVPILSDSRKRWTQWTMCPPQKQRAHLNSGWLWGTCHTWKGLLRKALWRPVTQGILTVRNKQNEHIPYRVICRRLKVSG
jgi:hypothetical protein